MNILNHMVRGYRDNLDLIIDQILYYEYKDKLTDPDKYGRKLFKGNLAMQ